MLLIFIMARGCLFIFIAFLCFTLINGSKTCGCYMLGTFSNIDEKSICDSNTLQCKCYRNVIGKNCDQCADGFYNILSGHGCSNCSCNPGGSYNKTCHTLTGQCNCKPGFTGLRCDQCEAFAYKISHDQCVKCNCSQSGSTEQQCDSNGQCACLNNVKGKHCDTCIENMYNIIGGCIPCPPCYEHVRDSINNFTKYLNQIQDALEDVENNKTAHIQDYIHFINEIKLLKAKIQKMHMDYDNANDSFSSLDKINHLIRELNDFQNQINKFIQQINEEFNNKKIKTNIVIAGTNLKEANDLIGTCESALQNATKISKGLSRHNETMTKIAENALKASREIENQAEEFHNYSLNATISCGAACKIAEEFSKAQISIESELGNLSNEIAICTKGLDTLKGYCKDFHEKTGAAKEKALSLLENSNTLVIPDLNIITNSLTETNDELNGLEEILTNLNVVDGEINANKTAAEKNLEELKNKQKDVDNKFFLTKTYESRANKAINDTNNILESAKASLENLKEYEKIKQSAEESLNKISLIRKKIVAIASNSDDIKTLFQDLILIINDIEQMKWNLDQILQSDDENRIMFSKNIELIEELEKQELDISMKLQEYDIKMKNVRIDLKNLTEEQNNIETDIKRMLEYLLVLNTIPTSNKDLDAVEREILVLEDMMETVEYLRKEKEKLEDEVKNVKDIIEALPEDDDTLCESAKSEPKAATVQ